MKPDRLTRRLNWTIVDDPAPFQPERITGHIPITADNAGGHLWLRFERQTLRRLPATGAVVFTIRTYITPIEGPATRSPLPACADRAPWGASLATAGG